MTSRSPTRRHRSTPQIAPRTNFFPTLRSRARTYNELTTRLSHSPAPLLFSPSRSFLSSPLLFSKMEEVDAAGIPNCGFVFPRRYLLFHAGVHRMNEEGKLEGWTDDDDDVGSPFSPLFLPFSSSPFLLFPFPSPLPCLAFHSNGRVSLSPIEIQWWMVIGIKSCRC